MKIYLLVAPPIDVSQKNRFWLLFSKFERKGDIESNFLNTPSGWLNLNHQLINVVLTLRFNQGSSISVIKYLISISPFVTKVAFVAFKSIFSNKLSIKACFKSLFEKFQLVHIVFYRCVLCSAISLEKDIFQENQIIGRYNLS